MKLKNTQIKFVEQSFRDNEDAFENCKEVCEEVRREICKEVAEENLFEVVDEMIEMNENETNEMNVKLRSEMNKMNENEMNEKLKSKQFFIRDSYPDYTAYAYTAYTVSDVMYKSFHSNAPLEISCAKWFSKTQKLMPEADAIPTVSAVVCISMYLSIFTDVRSWALEI